MNKEEIQKVVEELRKNFETRFPTWSIQGKAADIIESLLNAKIKSKKP